MRLRVATGVGLQLLVVTNAPVRADGLFDLLLGGARPAVEAPAERETLTVHRRNQRRPPPRVAQKPLKLDQTKAGHRAEVAIDPAKLPDWYLHDRTLRRGDIVVLKDGVLVYTGARRGRGAQSGDFARLREARFLPVRMRDFVAKATAANPTSAAVVAPQKPKVRPSTT